MNKKLLLITSGEPSGIGIDICLDLVNSEQNICYKIVVIGDINVFKERSLLLNKNITFNVLNKSELFNSDFLMVNTPSNVLNILHVSCYDKVIPGVLNKSNSRYVIDILDYAIELTKQNVTNMIVTGPVHKGIINKAGINFSGHTEYFADAFKVKKVVMMLANEKMRVALLTTHIPLYQVSKQVTKENLNQTLEIIFKYLSISGLNNPKVAVCGLNPHAGEDGEIGSEELEIINPVIQSWRNKKYNIHGCFSADTIFLQANNYDLILAMYHDQGLPVLKYSGFNTGVNITLGLPIIRTSVDHGTALNLAGTGSANSDSLKFAIDIALKNNI